MEKGETKACAHALSEKPFVFNFIANRYLFKLSTVLIKLLNNCFIRYSSLELCIVMWVFI